MHFSQVQEYMNLKELGLKSTLDLFTPVRSKDSIFQAFLKQELLELEQGSSVATV